MRKWALRRVGNPAWVTQDFQMRLGSGPRGVAERRRLIPTPSWQTERRHLIRTSHMKPFCQTRHGLRRRRPTGLGRLLTKAPSKAHLPIGAMRFTAHPRLPVCLVLSAAFALL